VLGRPGVLTAARIRRWGARRLPARDRAALEDPVVDAVLAALREGVRPGIEGVWSDAQIYARDWGFALERVTVPLQVWHGTADSIVPAFTSRAYEAAPLCRRQLVPDEGHYSLILVHGPRIVAALAAGLPR
jgi:pimeloyl-ACP methyl ester carboxylesterase